MRWCSSRIITIRRVTWVRPEYRQEANGIPIFQGEIRFGFTTKGALARLTGNLAPGLDYSKLADEGSDCAGGGRDACGSDDWRECECDADRNRREETEGARVTQLANGPFVRPIRTELVYFPIDPGVATLAYSMVLWEKVDAYYVVVDAIDGRCSGARTSPTIRRSPRPTTSTTRIVRAPLSPTNAPARFEQFRARPSAARTVTLIGNEAPNAGQNNLGLDHRRREHYGR